MPRSSRLLAVLTCSLAGVVGSGWQSSLAVAAEATYPLHADAATRTLVGANGQPFLFAGDAAWSLIAQLNQAEVEQYLSDRHSRGFNAVLVNLIEHKFATNAPANAFGQAPFSTPGDFSTPNADYFDHAEWVVAQAGQRGMLVALVPMYLGFNGGDQGWYQELVANGVTKAESYGRYVGQRFAKYPNVIWIEGGDMTPGTALPEIEAVISGIQAADTVHLHTAESIRGDSSLDDYNRPWLGLDAVYTDCNGAISKTLSEWLRATTLPMFQIEGIYENEGATTDCLLGQMYYPVLQGARGHVFGNRPIWLFDTGWQAALPSPGAQFMTHAAAVFRSREGGTLIPDTSGATVVSGGGTAGSPDSTAAARTASGKTVLVYVPTARTLQINGAQIPGPQHHAWWYDPQTGLAQDLGTSASAGTITMTTPAGGPWLLVLDDPSITTTPGLPPALQFFTLTPCRVADTRNATGVSGGPALAGGTTRNFPAAGICGIPSTASAVAINVTVVGQTDLGDLRLYASGDTAPLASTINFRAGRVKANNAIMPLGAGGQIAVQCDMPTSSGTTHFLFDVTGYFQ